jgi:nucleotide-binding universal stress UspA family protein/hemerythrin-like domain-containing protein
MYSHLLVPVEDSVLSSTNVGVAVELARRLGSRITFFHAAADLEATRAGANLKARDPDGFAESAFGDTLAVLSQHAVMAESAGVPYDTVYRTDDRCAEAIVDAAGTYGCDLIVMASHGPRGLAGWLQGSHTERVLRQSPIPVLVTRVTANEPVKAVEQVMAAIGDEHRSILAVVLAMQDMVRQSPGSWSAQELACLEAMLDFLLQLSNGIHHPKEEQYLHKVLRQSVPACHELLRELESQHLNELKLLRRCQFCLTEVTSELGAPSAPLVNSVRDLANAIQHHISLEESELFPLALQHLHADDWNDLALQFKEQGIAGTYSMPVTETRHLFTLIASLRLGVSGHGQGIGKP